MSVPSFESTDAKQPTAACGSGGKLPAVSFLTGSTAIGATMTYL